MNLVSLSIADPMYRNLTPIASILLILMVAFLTGCRPAEPAASPEVVSPQRRADASAEPASPDEHKSAEISDVFITSEQIMRRRKELDETVLSPETVAQKYEQTFVQFWDSLLHERDPYKVFQRFQFRKLIVGTPKQPESKDWGVPGIRIVGMQEPTTDIDHVAYTKILGEFEAKGWKIVQSEWHHSRFEPATQTSAPKSTISFEVHLTNSRREHRLLARGKLKIQWSDQVDHVGNPIPEVIDAADVQLIDQPGTPMFHVTEFDPKKVIPERFPRISPLLLYDLNRDGLPEIVMAGCNLVYVNQGNNGFKPENFLKHGLSMMAESGILADFTGDGLADFIGAAANELKLRIFAGSNKGFVEPSEICFPTQLDNPHTMTAGDIDHDGDLDLYVGQWRAPYERGSMPTPYYDANDGHPDYLLRNDGEGHFTDITADANLADKRNRRTYSASFIDLDHDGDLDLVRVADFAGLDLYLNDGQGRFIESTQEMTDERHSFGMSHTFDDFDLDGELDFYMIGMSSTTARRLEHLGISRTDNAEHAKFRMKMGYGNRMYLSRQGRFVAPAFQDQIARTGWSWGCTSTDFDNDGDPDIYVANGHVSGQSTKDYCTRFWCHDIYEGTSKVNPSLDRFYTTTLLQALGHQVSWNGYEHNSLFLNRNGEEFLNASFLLGVAFEFDARAVASEDLNGDGLRDLLVVEYDSQGFQQKLHVAMNGLGDAGNWIGIRLQEEQGGSAVGAFVTAETANRRWVHRTVTGDSFTAQHSTTVHFGIGDLERLESVSVTWPNGRKAVIKNPEINHYHIVGMPDAD